jgi:hypothetical protein
VISVLAEPGTERIPPLGRTDADEVTCVLTRPVFLDGGARRRRIMVRAGGALAVLCVAYLVMLGVSVTALPTAGRPVAGAGAARHSPTAGSTPARASGRSSAAQEQMRLAVQPRATPDSDGDEPVVPPRRAPAPPPTRSLPAPPTPPPTARPTAPPRHDHDRDRPTTTPKPPTGATPTRGPTHTPAATTRT